MRAALRIIVLVFAAALSTTAFAETDEAALAKLVAELGQKSFAKKSKAVDALVATGDPRVIGILEAMLSRNLYRRKADGAILLKATKDGKSVCRNPLTGAPVAEKHTPKKV